jgi:hypothetical protein
MIDIKTGLNKSFDSVQINRLLYDNLPVYKRPDILMMSLFIIIGIVLYILAYLSYLNYTNVIYIFIPFVLMGYVFINWKIRRRLKEKGLSVNKGVVTPWHSREYQEKKMILFYESLIEEKLLHDSKSDIKLLEEYECLCTEESNFFKTNQSFLISGGVLALFILPVWSEIVKLLIQESLEDKFVESLKLIASYILFIGVFIFILSKIDKALIHFVNGISRKQKEIARLIKLLRLNLMIKYSKGDEEKKEP